jgi:hypothetical protein
LSASKASIAASPDPGFSALTALALLDAFAAAVASL